MIQDLQGNDLTIGTRIAAADNLCGVKIRIGNVIGYTKQRVKIQFDDDTKPSSKAPHTLVKIFNQEK